MAYLPVEFVDLFGHGVHFEPQLGRRFVDQVDRLVGQEARRDVPVRQFDRRDDRLVFDPHLMVVFVTLFQAPQNRNGVHGRRFVDHYLLETPFERFVLFEIFLELVQRRGADRAQLAPRQRRFQDVGRIHRAVAFAGSDQRMDFVDEQQDLAFGRNYFFDHGFQPLFELALVLRSGDQRAHIQRINLFASQILRDVAVDDPVRDSFGDGRFADARFADQDRVVFGSPRQDLQYPPDLLVPADHRVEFAFAGLFVQVDRVFAERVVLLLAGLAVDGRTFAQLFDRRDQFFFGRAGVFQQPSGLPFFGDDTEQQVFDRGVFVAERFREIRGFLNDRGTFARKIGVAAFDFRQPVDLLFQYASQRPDVYAEFL